MKNPLRPCKVLTRKGSDATALPLTRNLDESTPKPQRTAAGKFLPGNTESRRHGLTAARVSEALIAERQDFEAAPLGNGWTLHKSVCGKAREAVCELWSHQFGWELRLIIDGGILQRSHSPSMPESDGDKKGTVKRTSPETEAQAAILFKEFGGAARI